ncbi:hypothetical protein [Clostridium sp. CTA-6]
MCEYCKHASVCGDNVECLISHREPTYEEYNKCDNFELHDELEKKYQDFLKLQ